MLIFVYLIFILSGSTLALNTKQCLKYKSLSDSIHEELAFRSPKPVGETKIRYFERKVGSTFILGHAVYVGTPDKLEVLEPGADVGGCQKKSRVLARETSTRASNCEVVMNAGFFETRTGDCYGNIINKGKVIQNFGGFRNAHFGIKKSGAYYFGYPTVEEVDSGDFQMLIGGVIWLIRRSKNVINESISRECEPIQDTGSLKTFCSVLSARSVIGVTRKQELVLITVGGRTNQFGINLYQLTDLLLSPEFDFVDAINLDGGGSTTLVVNNTLVTLPSDRCSGESLFVCERPVSTVLCVRNSHDNNSNYDNSTNTKYIIFITIIVLLIVVVLALIVFQVFKISKRPRASDSTTVNKVNDNTKYDDMLHFDRQQLLEMQEEDVEYLN